MSALENPDLESALKGNIVLNELYLRGAFDEETAIAIKDFGNRVDGLLFGAENGLLIQEIREVKPLVELLKTEILVEPLIQDSEEESLVQIIKKEPSVIEPDMEAVVYLTPKGKALVEALIKEQARKINELI